MEKIRLNKLLSEMGICSRREADRLVEAGRITVDGMPAVMGQKVSCDQRIVCDGRLICGPEEAGEGADQEAGEGAGGGADKEAGEGGGGVRNETHGGANKEANGESKREAGREDGPPARQATSSFRRPKPVWLVVNKPRGIVCTTSDKDRAENIVEMIHYPARVYPVGRLDKDSEGLILMTNQGDLVNKIMRSGNAHEKEYEVTVNKPLTEAFLEAMVSGVELKELNQTTRPCEILVTGIDTFRMVLTQGLNRQIRRMCEALGYRVLKLKRIRIMNIRLGNLKTGSFRRMTREEYEEMVRILEESGSSNLPFAERIERQHEG